MTRHDRARLRRNQPGWTAGGAATELTFYPPFPAEVMRDVVEFATAGRAPEERDAIIAMLQQSAHEWAVHNFKPP